MSSEKVIEGRKTINRNYFKRNVNTLKIDSIHETSEKNGPLVSKLVEIMTNFDAAS